MGLADCPIMVGGLLPRGGSLGSVHIAVQSSSVGGEANMVGCKGLGVEQKS